MYKINNPNNDGDNSVVFILISRRKKLNVRARFNDSFETFSKLSTKQIFFFF